MKPAKPFSTTMDEQTFVPPTMRALYHSPLPTTTTTTNNNNNRIKKSLTFDTDFPTPKPSASQYLLKVQAAAFSHDEIRLAGALNPTQCIPQIPLHNICGTVISTPSQDHWSSSGPRFKVDDVVFGLINYTRDGGAADYVLATEDELAFKPRNITAVEAAAIPLPALTAWQALFKHGGFNPDETDSTSTSTNTNANTNTNRRRSLELGKKLLPKQANNNNNNNNSSSSHPPRRRILISNAGDTETGLQALHLLRSATLFPAASSSKPRVCVTCSSAEQATHLRAEFPVAETVVAPAPASMSVSVSEPEPEPEPEPGSGSGSGHGSAADGPEIDLAATFRENRWEPVDFVLDCAGGQVLRQAHSADVVRKQGVVVTAMDAEPAQNAEWEGAMAKRRVATRFLGIEPDGEALGRIARLVEEGSVSGRVAREVDLVDGGDVLDAGASGALRGKMIVVKVN